MGTIVLATLSVVITISVCFVSSWELSLVLFPAFPIVFLSYRLSHKLLHSSGTGDGDCLETSAQLVIESVSNIKTVVSLGAQEYFLESVSANLSSHLWYVTRIIIL